MAHRVYLKSIEQVIPYNQMARRNKEMKKYQELSRSNKFMGVDYLAGGPQAKAINKTYISPARNHQEDHQ